MSEDQFTWNSLGKIDWPRLEYGSNTHPREFKEQEDKDNASALQRSIYIDLIKMGYPRATAVAVGIAAVDKLLQLTE